MATPKGYWTEFGPAAQRYTSRFKNFNLVGSSASDQADREEARKNAAQHSHDYYIMTNRHYEVGWVGNHLHYAAYAPGDSLHHATNFCIYQMALLMELKPHMVVLDVGCGFGQTGRELAKFVGCTVIGINFSQLQVNRAYELTLQEGLTHLCTFIRGDFNDLPFPSNYFDAAINIEATAHSNSLPNVYSEVSRVLKPGGKFANKEFSMSDAPGGNYDATNPHHVRIRNRIEVGNAVTAMQPVSHARAALLASGFKIHIDMDYAERYAAQFEVPALLKQYQPRDSLATTLAARTDLSTLPHLSSVQIPYKDHTPDKPHAYLAPGIVQPFSPIFLSPPNTFPSKAEPFPIPPPPRPWYWPIMGDKTAQTMYLSSLDDAVLVKRLSYRLRRFFMWYLKLMQWLGVVPEGVVETQVMMEYCVEAALDGGKEGVFTPNWLFVCEKVAQPRVEDVRRCEEERKREEELEKEAVARKIALEEA